MRRTARAGLIPGPDLFGFVPQIHVASSRRSAACAAELEQKLDELQRRHAEVLDDLQRSIEGVIEVFSMAMVDYQDGENAGDIDRLIEELDEEITDAFSFFPCSRWLELDL